MCSRRVQNLSFEGVSTPGHSVRDRVIEGNGSESATGPEAW